MPSIREQILAALLVRLEAVPGATAKREAPLPEAVPVGGLIILRDGDPGDPEVVLSPVTYLWEHQAEIEIILQRGQDDDSAALDTLLMAVGGALTADRSLGGLAEWLDWGAPKTSGLAIDGAAALRGATVPVPMTKDAVVPRGIRLNNPGNIKESPGDKTQWQGERATDDDPVFEEFVSPEAGIRALTRILLGYQRRYGLNTVAGIINRWAPGCENDTGSYIAHVASRLGVTSDQAIDLTKADTMAGLVEAIIRHENGQQPYAREVILAGIGMGLGSA